MPATAPAQIWSIPRETFAPRMPMARRLVNACNNMAWLTSGRLPKTVSRTSQTPNATPQASPSNLRFIGQGCTGTGTGHASRGVLSLRKEYARDTQVCCTQSCRVCALAQERQFYVTPQWSPLPRKRPAQGPHPPPLENEPASRVFSQTSRCGQTREVRLFGISSRLGHDLCRAELDGCCLLEAHAGRGHARQLRRRRRRPHPHQQQLAMARDSHGFGMPLSQRLAFAMFAYHPAVFGE